MLPGAMWQCLESSLTLKSVQGEGGCSGHLQMEAGSAVMHRTGLTTGKDLAPNVSSAKAVKPFVIWSVAYLIYFLLFYFIYL